MSVIIKGMRLPNNCLACDFLNPFVEKPYCRRLMKISPTTGRLEDCPLAEVPTPHGRLKDADAFDSRMREAGGMVGEALREDFKDGILTTLVMMRTAPTVIEAEEAEEPSDDC